MPLYTLAASPSAVSLLTKKVTDNTATMAGQQETAEVLLGLTAPVYTTAADVARIALAIVHQMNFQAAQGIDPRFMSGATSGRADQLNSFRDRYVDPVAAALVAAVVVQYAAAGGFAETMTSFRSRAGTST